jgi:hypothetical protein
MRKLLFFLPLSLSFVACVPFKANKPIQVSQANIPQTQQQDKSLQKWRIEQLEKIKQIEKEMEEQNQREYEENNPILNESL